MKNNAKRSASCINSTIEKGWSRIFPAHPPDPNSNVLNQKVTTHFTLTAWAV
jgi:hypothetical protein